ncbi:TetR/AcrR family transcriptional regulator C-terminal domain-containing protein [Streptomyces sp. NPDC059272]|uniref:TetR/AcrR family transcriptional regulator C-terminal domain-containing protein n=1 Tax=Streptomyces sp. NPDC059272 TaxID=3346800 RepID=UPI003686F1BD
MSVGPILAETTADRADRRNKQNLLDEMAEMAEMVLATALPDGHDQDGETEVALLAHQLRQAPLAQREDTRVVGVGYAAKRHSLALAERLVAVMRRAGLNGVAALWATSTVFCYVLGEALDQQGLTDHARDRLTFPGARRTYPRLFSIPVEEILNFDDRFASDSGSSSAASASRSRRRIFPEGTPTLVPENISPLSSTREALATRLSPANTHPLRAVR